MPSSGRLLAVVPARGGSKRLPHKNVLPLGGKPLIAWTVEAALASGVFDEVLVSTDDALIAEAARAAGAQVPWLRPAHLATDTATSADVLRHALDAREAAGNEFDAVVLLQPTSPFRSAASIRAAVELYRARPPGSAAAVVSVSPVVQHPAWSFSLDGDTMLPLLGWESLRRRSQDLAPVVALNGAIYVIPAKTIRAGEPLVAPGVRPFLMNDAAEALDIDTPDDWRAAEQFLAAREP